MFVTIASVRADAFHKIHSSRAEQEELTYSNNTPATPYKKYTGWCLYVLKKCAIAPFKKTLQSSCVLLPGLRNKDVANKLNETLKHEYFRYSFFALRSTGLLHRHSTLTASHYLSHPYGVSQSV